MKIFSNYFNFSLINLKIVTIIFLIIYSSKISISQTNGCAYTGTGITVGTTCNMQTFNSTNSSDYWNSASGCGASDLDDAWWWFTATASTTNIEYYSNRDAVLHVFSGACSTGASALACSDNFGSNGTESITLSTVPGINYAIRIQRYNSNSDMNGTVCVWSPCSAPTAPTVSTITQPNCTTSTGSVLLTGLPSSGSWTITRSPGGTTTTGSGTSTTISNLPANASYTFTVTNSSNCTSSSSASVIINLQPSVPAQPSLITGIIDPEVGSTQTYFVTNTGGVTYNWNFPPTWIINSGQGTNSVIVTIGTQNGTISVTPSNSCGNGTPRTLSTNIPNYRAQIIGANFGSSDWCSGDERNVSVEVKNTGIATWNSAYTTNIGVKWDTWSDYHSRVTAGPLTAGSSQTYVLTIKAMNAAAGPAYLTNLSEGTYNLVFDVVNEASCWFGNNNASCGPGNSIYTTSAITVKNGPTVPNAGTDEAICKGQSFQLSGNVVTPNIQVNSSSTFSYSGSGYDCNNFTVGGTTSGMPANATITSIVWNASMNVSCSWSEMDLYINNTYIGWTCGATNITYNGLNGQSANGQKIEIDSWDNDFYCDLMTMNLSFTVNYTYPTAATASYSWSPTTGLNDANIANPIASPTATTTYTMTASYNGCSVSDDVVITVDNYGIDGSLAASTNTSVCVNNPITVTAASGDGNPRYWIQSPVGAASWNIFDNQASNSSSNGYSYTPTSAGTYRIHARWQNSCGFCWDEAGHDFNTNNKCPNFIAVDFTAVAQPTAPTTAVKLPNTATACAGSTLTLGGAASGGEAGLSCAIEYQYSTNNGANWTSTGTTIPSFTAATGTNIIQAKRTSCQSGCGTTSWNTIASWTVNANPVAAISGTNAVCVGSNSTFTASGGTTYAWNTGVTTAAITVANANTYTVTVTDANGCTSSANRTLTVNEPNTSISVNGINISNGDYLWNGSNNANWDVIANWYVFNGSNFTVASTLPTTLTNVFISASAGQCVSNTNNVSIPASAPVQSVKDINISVGSQVVLAGSNNNFNVSGNWNNAGTFNATSGTVIFNGSSNQTFSCGGSSSLKDITIENTALNGKLTMNSNLEVSGTVYINNGEFVVPATRIVRSNKVNMGSNGKLLLGGEMRVNE